MTSGPFQNQEGREPQNAAADAMRHIQELRGANTALRRFENAPPPLTDEAAAEAFTRAHGLKVDAQGRPLEGLPDQKTLEERRRELAEAREEDEMPTQQHAMTAREYLESRGLLPEPGAPPLANGIDLDQAIVLVEGEPFEMTAEEVKAITIFTSDVYARGLQAKIDAHLAARGLRRTPPKGDANAGQQAVPPVRGKQGRRRVQPKPKQG